MSAEVWISVIEACAGVGFVPFVLLGFSVGLAAVATLVRHSKRPELRGLQDALFLRPEQRAAYTFVAESLDLEPAPTGVHPALRGMRNGMPVRIEYVPAPSKQAVRTWTRIVVSGASYGLRFELEGVGSGLRKVFGGEDHRTGDDPFDDAVAVRGDPALLLALLDVDTRRAVQHAVVFEAIRVAEGEVTLERHAELIDPRMLETLIGNAVDLARRLADPGPTALAARLARNVKADPLAIVRLRSLVALDAAHSGPAAAAAAQEALGDADAAMRLLAARILGDTERIRAASIDALRGLAPHDCERLTRALQKVGDPAPLLALLDVPVAAVRVAALHGLARIGTPEVIEALLPHTKGVFGDETVRAAARDAITSIQARVGTHAVGRLALVEGESGAVSLATEPGRVSLPDREWS